MFYTLIALIVWLLDGAPTFTPAFNPPTVAFLLAILADLAFHGWPWFRTRGA